MKPIYSRLDNRLKAHIFVCVLSLIMYRYMIRKLKHLKLSESRIVEEIKNMRIAFIKQQNSNSVKKVLETMTQEQIQIYNTLNLQQFIL